MSHNNKAYLAFYDLDRTILRENSATHMVDEARRRGIMSPAQYREALRLSLIYKLGLRDPVKIINRMLTWVEGLETEMVRKLCEEIWQDRLALLVRPEILESFAKHRAQGAGIILLSSATCPICRPVHLHLQMEGLVCSELESENGRLTGRLQGHLVYGTEKAVRMDAYCREHGHDPQKAWYYGDSRTDRHVMEAVGNPVAVAPDRRLSRISRSRNWPILTRDR